MQPFSIFYNKLNYLNLLYTKQDSLLLMTTFYISWQDFSMFIVELVTRIKRHVFMIEAFLIRYE